MRHGCKAGEEQGGGSVGVSALEGEEGSPGPLAKLGAILLGEGRLQMARGKGWERDVLRATGVKGGAGLYASLLQVAQSLLCAVSTCVPRETESELSGNRPHLRLETPPLLAVLEGVLAA